LGGGRGGGGAVPKLDAGPASWISVGSDTGSSTGAVAQLLITNRDKLKNTPNIEPPLSQHSREVLEELAFLEIPKVVTKKFWNGQKPEEVHLMLGHA
jgi:hypothetical protein